jgi:hypothetical protein
MQLALLAVLYRVLNLEKPVFAGDTSMPNARSSRRGIAAANPIAVSYAPASGPSDRAGQAL